jgi:hypothetical protein
MNAGHNTLFRELAYRERINCVLVHERLDDPALFVDACHFTPEGIDRLADAFEPAVADLVKDRPGFRAWESTIAPQSPSRISLLNRDETH